MNAPSKKSDKSRFYQEVQDDHAELKQLLSSIGETLESQSVPAVEVLDLLATLADRLQSHFFLEEDGGYFVDALDHSPRLESQVRGLMEQHPAMLDRCRNIAIEAKKSLHSDEFWIVTQERFAAFHELLLRHERGEDELLQDAYMRDIGDND